MEKETTPVVVAGATINKQYRKAAAFKAIRITRKAYDQYDIRASLVDMLTDIRHACDHKGLPFADMDRLAQDHYNAECLVEGVG